MNNVKDLASFVFAQCGTTLIANGYDTYQQLGCYSERELEEVINDYLKATGCVLFKAMQISEFNDDKYS